MARKVTSPRVASIAGKQLADNRLSKRTKAPIASALSQREAPKKRK